MLLAFQSLPAPRVSCSVTPPVAQVQHRGVSLSSLRPGHWPAISSASRLWPTGSSVCGRSSRCNASASATLETDFGPVPYGDLAPLKAALLASVAGLDRGVAAGTRDINAVDAAAFALEAAGEPFKLPEDLVKLDGQWRLVYSSGFASGSFGGRRPGPRFGGLPLVLGQVYQRVDVVMGELDNIVELRLVGPWPLPPVELRGTLAHTFEVTGDQSIKIIFESTTIKPEGPLDVLPPLTLPKLPDFIRQSDVNAGSFDTTFVDEEVRVSRGDRGELRIFVRGQP